MKIFRIIFRRKKRVVSIGMRRKFTREELLFKRPKKGLRSGDV